MRKVIRGDGLDSTNNVLQWLQTASVIYLANLFLIGDVEDPNALRLTDWESPLLWSRIGTFQPAVIGRDTVKTQVGLEMQTLEVQWSPLIGSFTKVLKTTSPYEQARLGYFDNMEFRCWTVYMQSPGDADSLGASELFGGRIGDVTVQQGAIHFTVHSFLDVLNQAVPTNVIELTNTLAQYKGATPPAGHTAVPQFSVITGSTETVLILRETSPNADHIFSDNELRAGFLVFNKGTNMTLGGLYRTIYANKTIVVSATNYNEVVLYTPLPWAPTVGVDTCFIAKAFGLDQSEGDYQGFPAIPSPSSAV